jgi:collagen triple helix repeat protein
LKLLSRRGAAYVGALKDRVGGAGLVVAVFALIAAVAGGAVAAGGLTSQQEKQVKKIAKKFAGKPGKPGAAGPAGPVGTSGPAGAKGDKGDPGSSGANGKSVVTSELEPEEGGCQEGGTELVVEGSGNPEAVCNGEPWTAGGTLPAGATLTGAWKFFSAESEAFVEQLWETISFPIPLEAPLDGDHAWVMFSSAGGGTSAEGTGDVTSGSNTITNLTTSAGKWAVGAPVVTTPSAFTAGTTITACSPSCGESATSLTLSANATISATGAVVRQRVPAECENAEHAGTAGPSNPEADPGFLCVYRGGNSAGDISSMSIFRNAAGPGADTFGALLTVPAPEGGPAPEFSVTGSWAVTG